MNSKRLALARAFDLLDRAHGVGGRVTEHPGWMELRLLALLEGIAVARACESVSVVQVMAREPALLSEIAATLRVGEARFFRDQAQWVALETQILPVLRVEQVRALSVGCATGEEAYTLAMVLDRQSHSLAEDFRVLGADRSELGLIVARAAAYPARALADLPEQLRTRYFDPVGPDSLAVVRGLRSKVSFVARDLTSSAVPGEFEIIVCKNTLLYLAERERAKALANLLRALRPGGALLVSRSEVSLVRALGQGSHLVAPGLFVFERKAGDLR